MKIAIITDSSAVLNPRFAERENVFVLDIPVSIDGVDYVEGVNLTAQEFYEKMAATAELPKTSQPSLASLAEILSQLKRWLHTCGRSLFSGGNFWFPSKYSILDG